MKKHLKATWAAGGIAGGLLLAILAFPGQINSFATEAPVAWQRVKNWLFLDTTYTGTWLSYTEGDIEETPEMTRIGHLPGGPVAIRLHVYRGRAEGEILSTGLRDHYVFSRVQVSGAEFGGSLFVVVWDWIHGQRTALAWFNLEPRGDDELYLRAIWQPANLVPTEAILQRNNDALPDTAGEMNPAWMEALLRAARHIRPPQPNPPPRGNQARPPRH